MTSFVNSSMFRAAGWRLQSTQDSSLSWQYALLLPCCVRLSSSPWSSMGAEREHQRGEEGAFGPLPLIEDPRVVGGPFGAAVPREIVVVAVAIVLAVGLVVLLVVRDQIVQREPVVGGDEVDGRPRPAAATAGQIAGAGQPVGQGTCLVLVALPDRPHRIPVDPVP